MSLLNSAMSRFEEATQMHGAVRTLRLRASKINPAHTAEQAEKRIAMIELMCGLLEKARDDALDLGLHEYTTHLEGKG